MWSLILGLFQDLPGHLQIWSTAMGYWLYLFLFLIIFAETGLVVFPILPGDSLLFALGAMASAGVLDFWALLALLILAAVLGDALNYFVGKWVAARLAAGRSTRWLNTKYLQRTHEFYERHGGKTIVLARFVPIVRTYAPFVAGMGAMSYQKFAMFNVVGAVLWITSFLGLGFAFGNFPSVKANFHLVVVAIIVLSVLPGIIEFARHRRQLR